MRQSNSPSQFDPLAIDSELGTVNRCRTKLNSRREHFPTSTNSDLRPEIDRDLVFQLIDIMETSFQKSLPSLLAAARASTSALCQFENNDNEVTALCEEVHNIRAKSRNSATAASLDPLNKASEQLQITMQIRRDLETLEMHCKALLKAQDTVRNLEI